MSFEDVILRNGGFTLYIRLPLWSKSLSMNFLILPLKYSHFPLKGKQVPVWWAELTLNYKTWLFCRKLEEVLIFNHEVFKIQFWYRCHLKMAILMKKPQFCILYQNATLIKNFKGELLHIGFKIFLLVENENAPDEVSKHDYFGRSWVRC